MATEKLLNSYVAQSPRLNFPGSTDSMLAQQVRLYYHQNVTRIYEVGNKDIRLIAGRTCGESHFDGILGTTKAAHVFFKSFTDVCATNRSLSVSSTGSSKASTHYQGAVVLDNCFIGHLIQAIASKDMTIQDVVMPFLNMKLAG